MLRAPVLMALVLGSGSAFAQHNPIPLPRLPAGWPVLRLNSEQPPSCVFGAALGPGGTPAYFCGIIIRAPGDEVPATNGGALGGVLVDPTTGVVTAIASVPLTDEPMAVQCVLNVGVDCLYYFKNNRKLSLVTFSGTTLFANPMDIQDPPASGSPFVSNVSCVSWGSTSCFVMDQLGRIHQWTFQSGGHPQWTTPQDQTSSSGITSPAMPVNPIVTLADSFYADNRPALLSCSSSAPGTADCFFRGGAPAPSTVAGNLVRAHAPNGSGTPFNPTTGLSWAPTLTNLQGSLGTTPDCLSNVMAVSTCFFGFASGMTGLGSAPDDGSRPARTLGLQGTSRLQGALLQRSNVSIQPACVSFSQSPGPGAFECVYDYNAGVNTSDLLSGSNFADANIWLATTNGPLFWVQSLGVAAPSNEWALVTSLGRTFPRVVNNPKAVKSLTCANGPSFQSLCVAAIVESQNDLSAAGQVKKFRLVFQLVGAVGVPPVQPPVPVLVPVRH
jgi:hypothetical protein